MAMKLLALIIALLCPVLISGCIGQTNAGGGLFVSVQPDPSVVFSSGVVAINIDIDNKNTRSVTDVTAQIYDSGLLKGSQCRQQIKSMTPDEFKTLRCYYKAPQKETIMQNQLKTTVKSMVSYTADISAVQLIQMMDQSEYGRQSQSGIFKQSPSAYSYSDKNVKIDVEFSDSVPVIIRQNDQKDYFVYFTIKNIGNGLIKDLSYGDFAVSPLRSGQPTIVSCPDLSSRTWQLSVQGSVFPRIACKMSMPSGVSIVDNYGLLIFLKYRYEVRQDTDVIVMK